MPPILVTMQQHTGLRVLRQLGRLVSCAHAQFSTAQFPRSASQHLAALTQLHATVTQQQFNHRLLSSTCSLQRWRGISALQHQQHCQHDRPQQAQRTQLKPAAVDLRHYSKLQKQQCRHYSVDDAARRRLLAAQQRRQREQELAERRAASAASGQQQDQLMSPPPAAAVDSETTAIAPQESVPSEVQVANVVDHEALIVTRNIEWGTVLLGFEQATKYTVYDQGGNIVALIAEEITGIGNEIQRQLLRTRRSFKSTVLSADGSQVVFRVRRPAYLINSYMYIEDPAGEVIGEVRQRWHPWRRMYDLYIGKKQFATVNSGFLAWEFEMKDRHGNTLALIDRNFLGFAKELFTDAGKYVVHFGYSPRTAADMCTKTLQIRSGKEDVAVTPIAQMRTDVAVIPTYTGNQLVVQEPLPLSERLIALAAAISVDYNYFSRLSGHSGMFSPPLFMPLPVPSGGVGGVGTGAGSAAEGAAGVGTAAPTAAAGAEAAAGAGSMNPTPGATDASPGFTGSDDAGFSSGLGAQGSGFSDDADSFKWDTGGGGAGGDSEGWGNMLGGAGGGDDDSSSGLWGILASIWAMIFGD